MDTKQLIETVTKARRGDTAALQELYLDMYKSVFYLALRIVKNPEDAEDITQEVYITVQQKIAELREPAAFYGWVNQITVNQCNALLRKYKGLSRLDDEDEIINLIDDDPANLPDKALDDEATRKIILEVIDNLPDGQRACVILYYYTQNTIAQIADMLETNESTVKSRLALARAKIRAALEHKAEKEGIKLWGVPLALTPILREAFEQFVMPESAEARILEFISKATAENANTGDSHGADTSGNSGTSGRIGPKTGVAGAAKISMKLATKIFIGVVAAAVVTVGAIFLPPLFNAPDDTTPPGVTDTPPIQSGTETPSNSNPPDTSTPTETPSESDPPDPTATPVPDGDPIADFEYSINNNQATIIKYVGNKTVVVIPSNINGSYVRSIGDEAFRNYSGLTSVTIPNSVTSIGYYAFRDCSSLTSVTIPNSVTSIGDSAFYDCSGLTSVIIPNSVTSIGLFVFGRCSSLTSVTIPDSVTSISNGTFADCTSLTSVTIPNSITSIGDHMFTSCSSLTSVTIPSSVTRIGSHAFYGCSALTNVTIPNNVTSIADYAFFDCSGLTSMTIPNSVTNIGDYAFYSCSNLRSTYFEGVAPQLDTDVFVNTAPDFKIYYKTNMSGWSNSWNGYPAEPY